MAMRRTPKSIPALLVLAAASTSVFAVEYHLQRITPVLNQPTYLTQAPGDPANILYYTTRISTAISGFGASNTMGKVWRYDVTTQSSTVILDLSARNVINDTGLQTLAFHPDFNTLGAGGHGLMYVASAERGSTALNRVDSFSVLNADGSLKTPEQVLATGATILQYSNNAQNNHTINWIGFDPNAAGVERNYLYISTGDGAFGRAYAGGNGATGRPSQNPADVAGKILRVDIAPGAADAYPDDPLKNFAIPATNPIPVYNAAHPGTPLMGVDASSSPVPALGEVYITGVRNGYRVSFDRMTSDFWIGDVGENAVEEIDFIKVATNVNGPPVDLGWPQLEGTVDSNISGAPHTRVNPFTGVISLNPVQEYAHSLGLAVIGGYVYRGPVEELQGKYFFADFVSARVWMLEFGRDTDPATFNGNNGIRTDMTYLWNALISDPLDPTYAGNLSLSHLGGLDHIVSFAEDQEGNLYLIDMGFGTGFNGQYTASAGEIFKIVPGAPDVPAAAFWTGGLSGSWATMSGATANFNTDATSGISTDKLPGYSTHVVFASTAPAGTNLSTVLNRDFFVASVTVAQGTPDVTIANGTGGTFSLVLLGDGLILEPSTALTLGTALVGSGGIELGGTLAMTSSASISLQGDLTGGGKMLLHGNSTSGNLISVGGLAMSASGIVENATGSTATNTLEVNTPGAHVSGGTLRDGTTGRVGLRLNGGGTLTLDGSVTITGPVNVRSGKMIVNGAHQSLGDAASVLIGDTAALRGVLELNGGAVGGTSGTAGVQIGIGTSTGHLLVNAGTVTSTNELWVATANGGYGALTLNGGSVTTGSWLAVARGGGSGVLNVHGGVLTVNANPLTVGSFGGGAATLHAVATFTGGITHVARTLFVAEQNSAVVTISGTATVNVNGTSSHNSGVGLAFVGGNAASGTTGILNLNGGVLTTTRVMKAGGAAGTEGIFNFNGGTLRAAAGTPSAANFMTGLTKAYVHEGGAIIDDNGLALTIAQNLEAPGGWGVQSVAVLAPGTNYVGPPIVAFSGGGGSGATAIAHVDASGQLTGLTVTSPGVGYTAPPTVTLTGGGGTVPVLASILVPNVSGGLTKAGNGTLTLTGSMHAFTGAGQIHAGLLRFTGNSAGNTVGSFSGDGHLEIAAGAQLTTGGVTLGGEWSIHGIQHIRPLAGDAGTSKVSALPAIAQGTDGTYTGTLNLHDAILIVEASDGTDKSLKIAALQGLIDSGAAGGTWTGTGITSAVAAADSANLAVGVFDNAALNQASYGGQPVDAQSVIVAVSRLGDANRDGIVDIVDLAIVANNWQHTRDNWAGGDFNGDQVADIVDLAIVANNWQESSDYAGIAAGLIPLSGSPAASVPEPASAALLALSGVALLVRRRRHRPRPVPECR